MAQIREAKTEDIGAISELLASSWKIAYRGIVDDDYLDALKSDHWVEFLTKGFNDGSVLSMIIESDTEMIGAAIVSKTEKEDTACLKSLYLQPDKIGSGFGHVFYTAIEAELKNRGFSSCVIDVLENNERAIRFYKTHGFVAAGEEEEVVLGKRGYTCKIFKKTLN